jgi:hypothetical protein
MDYGADDYSCARRHTWPKPRIVKLTTRRGTILLSEPTFRQMGFEVFDPALVRQLELFDGSDDDGW